MKHYLVNTNRKTSNQEHLYADQNESMSHPCADSYKISSRLCDMIHHAEELFGQRDESYTVHHIETGHKKPQIMYFNNCPKGIYIRLFTDPAENMSRACYQLAHETVHLLAPVRGVANNLEEGVATYFGAYYMKVRMNEPNWGPVKDSYKEVLAKVKPTLDTDKYCIRELRRKTSKFSDMSKIKKDVYEVFKNYLNMADVEWLLKPFDR